MNSIDPYFVSKAVEIIGAEGSAEEDIEARVLAIADDPMIARRLIDWIPEAFGTVLVSHLGKVTFSNTFSAKNAKGKWETIPTTAEPIFQIALTLGQNTFHNGPKSKFERIASRSSVFASVNNLLNSGGSIDGAVSSGPALIGIPAEVYSTGRKPFWKRIFT